MATLQSDPLDARRVEQEVCSDARGGVVTFLGTTRDHFEGRRVVFAYGVGLAGEPASCGDRTP